MREITVIIPAHNEENTIAQVIDEVSKKVSLKNIIVVNNCSTDKTSVIALQKGARVVECPNKGKGYAMAEGLKHVTTNITVFIDGDLQIYQDDIIKVMTSPIINDDIDFVKSTFERNGGRVTELVAKPLLELLFTEDVNKFGQPLSGIIAGKTEKFRNIVLEKDYGVDIGILLDMIKSGAKIKEVYIGKIDNNSQSWDSLTEMAKEVAKAILKRANYIEK